MSCSRYRESLDARLDGELAPDVARDVDRHLATCEACAREYSHLVETSRLLSGSLMRYTAPDVLKARIRGALTEHPSIRAPRREVSGWWRQVAAALVVAVASSALTLAVVRGGPPKSPADELLASHIRSLLPGHLTDVVSTDQHAVKPWFNGRVDLSPTVPNLDSLGFPLVGGRADYVQGRVVPVVVYGRRQHMINVYAWPAPDAASSAPGDLTRNGYHFVTWRQGGLEYWAVSDLNLAELHRFVARFTSSR
jgi:anti-sigma factor RsiW